MRSKASRLRSVSLTVTVAAAAVWTMACDANDVIGPPGEAVAETSESLARAARADEGRISFMTYNIFVGAAIEDLSGIPDLEVPIVALQLFTEVLNADFPGRAEAIADDIERHLPHLIGLQEVSAFHIAVGEENGTPIFAKVLDFEDVLLAELASREMSYTYGPALEGDNFVVEVPMLSPTSACLADQSCVLPDCLLAGTCELTLIRLEDTDLILTRSDVAWENPRKAHYNFVLGKPPFDFFPLQIDRGWSSVDATFGDLKLRFGVTHLEPADDAEGNIIPPLAELQMLQAMELAGALGQEPELPVVVVGDLNTDAYGASTATYEWLTSMEAGGGGYTDVWPPGGGGGWTCCQEEDLLTYPSILDRRVDLILMKGDFGLGPKGFLGGVQTRILGSRGSDRIDSGLWPSDHAGVLAVMKLQKS